MNNHYAKILVLSAVSLAFTLFISACGGGGGSSNSGTPVTGTGSDNGAGTGPATGTGTGTVTHNYFKTVVGSTSSYVSGRVDTIMANNNNTMTLRVDENGTSTQLTLAVTGSAIAISSIRELDTTGGLVGQTSFSPALKIFPSVTTVGTTETQTITVTAADNSTGSGSCTLSVLAQEPVTLASGTTYQNTLKIENSCTEDITWFAPGVGPVMIQYLDNSVDQLGTPTSTSPPSPPPTSSNFPAELVGTWSRTSASYTFRADGTFDYTSVMLSPYPCISSSKTTNYLEGTASVSGSSITLNVTGGRLDSWGCYVYTDGSPTSSKPSSPRQYTETWSISGNVLTMDNGGGGAYDKWIYTKE